MPSSKPTGRTTLPASRPSLTFEEESGGVIDHDGSVVLDGPYDLGRLAQLKPELLQNIKEIVYDIHFDEDNKQEVDPVRRLFQILASWENKANVMLVLGIIPTRQNYPGNPSKHYPDEISLDSHALPAISCVSHLSLVRFKTSLEKASLLRLLRLFPSATRVSECEDYNLKENLYCDWEVQTCSDDTRVVKCLFSEAKGELHMLPFDNSEAVHLPAYTHSMSLPRLSLFMKENAISIKEKFSYTAF